MKKVKRVLIGLALFLGAGFITNICYSQRVLAISENVTILKNAELNSRVPFTVAYDKNLNKYKFGVRLFGTSLSDLPAGTKLKVVLKKHEQNKISEIGTYDGLVEDLTKAQPGMRTLLFDVDGNVLNDGFYSFDVMQVLEDSGHSVLLASWNNFEVIVKDIKEGQHLYFLWADLFCKANFEVNYDVNLGKYRFDVNLFNTPLCFNSLTLEELTKANYPAGTKVKAVLKKYNKNVNSQEVAVVGEYDACVENLEGNERNKTLSFNVDKDVLDDGFYSFDVVRVLGNNGRLDRLCSWNNFELVKNLQASVCEPTKNDKLNQTKVKFQSFAG